MGVSYNYKEQGTNLRFAAGITHLVFYHLKLAPP